MAIFNSFVGLPGRVHCSIHPNSTDLTTTSPSQPGSAQQGGDSAWYLEDNPRIRVVKTTGFLNSPESGKADWWWLEHGWLMTFHEKLGMECHHPNWRTHSIIFSEGLAATTNQKVLMWLHGIQCTSGMMDSEGPKRPQRFYSALQIWLYITW